MNFYIQLLVVAALLGNAAANPWKRYKFLNISVFLFYKIYSETHQYLNKFSYGFWDNQWFGRNQICLKLKLGALQFMPGIKNLNLNLNFYSILDRYSSVFHCWYITENFLIFTGKSEIFLMIARKKVFLNARCLEPTTAGTNYRAKAPRFCSVGSTILVQPN
jgi:hypothetical protein